MKKYIITFSLIFFLSLLILIPQVNAESYGPYQFTFYNGKNSVNVEVSAKTSAIANTGTITFEYEGEIKTAEMDNGRAPINGDNSSGEVVFSNGIKFKLEKGKIKFKKPRSKIWYKMSQIIKYNNNPSQLQ